MFSRFDLNESSVFDCITHAAILLTEIEEQFLMWPNNAQLARNEAAFHERYGNIKNEN